MRTLELVLKKMEPRLMFDQKVAIYLWVDLWKFEREKSQNNKKLVRKKTNILMGKYFFEKALTHR